MSIISVNNLTFGYEGRAVCRGVSFSVMQGERVALHGKNGSRKSTILKLILGEDIAHTGGLTLASGRTFTYGMSR